MSEPQRRAGVGKWLTISAWIAWMMPGCAPSAARPEAEPSAAAAPAASNPAAKSIAVKLIDGQAYDAIIAQQRGRVVVVDFWATWCQPCMQQLPHTIDLAAKHADDDLAVATVSMDEPGAQRRVEQVLGDRGADKVLNFMAQNGGGSQAMEDFEIPGGALPHYKLYDRAGKLRRTFEVDPAAEKQFTTQDIDAAVEELLGER